MNTKAGRAVSHTAHTFCQLLLHFQILVFRVGVRNMSATNEQAILDAMGSILLYTASMLEYIFPLSYACPAFPNTARGSPSPSACSAHCHLLDLQAVRVDAALRIVLGRLCFFLLPRWQQPRDEPSKTKSRRVAGNCLLR